MNRFRRVPRYFWPVLAFCLLAQIGCKDPEHTALAVPAAAPSRPTASAPAASAPSVSNADVEKLPPGTVLIQIGDVDQITQGEFERSMVGALPDRYGMLAISMVESHLLFLYLKDHPGLIDENKIDQPIQEEIKKGRTLEQVVETLKKKGMSLEDFRRLRRLHLIRTALIEAGDKHGDDPEYRKKTFEQDPQAFNGTEVRAHHILISVPPYNTPEQREEKRRRLEDIRQQLLSGQLTWENALAATGEAPNAGELGWVRRHSVNEPLAAATMALTPGELSPVVESGLGFHIVQALERHEGNLPVDHQNAVRDLKIWLEQEPQYLALMEMRSKYPPVGIRPPARTPFMAANERVPPPPIAFRSHPPASAPASRPAKRK